MVEIMTGLLSGVDSSAEQGASSSFSGKDSKWKSSTGPSVWRRRWSVPSSALLQIPVLVLLGLAFVVPVALFLLRSVQNDEITYALPNTLVVLRDWDGQGLPPKAAFDALAGDLRHTGEVGELGSLARRLNYQFPGMRELIMSTSRKLAQAQGGSADLASIHPAWANHETWALLKQEGSAFTPYYLLAAIGLERLPDVGLAMASSDKTPFIAILVNTITISLSVTLLCLVIGYPLAWGLANFRPWVSRVMLVLVLLPFWMSLLVRTAGWIILLQTNGPVNNFLIWSGLTDNALPLMYSRTGVMVAMTHILLPFMVLPIYSNMTALPSVYTRAAVSLGANPIRAFIRVYFPLTLSGVGAGCLLTWILAVGYYITPALVGSTNDQMISYYIAFYTNTTVNWGQASALAVWLIALTMLILVFAGRFVDVRNIRMR